MSDTQPPVTEPAAPTASAADAMHDQLVKVDNVAAFTDRKSHYYWLRWLPMIADGRAAKETGICPGLYMPAFRPSLNWAALLVPVLWLFYRRLYWLGIAGALFNASMMLFDKSIGLADTGLAVPMMLFSFLPNIVFGFFGNALYLRRYTRQLYKAMRARDETMQRLKLEDAGGTSLVGLLVLMPITLLVSMGGVAVLKNTVQGGRMPTILAATDLPGCGSDEARRDLTRAMLQADSNHYRLLDVTQATQLQVDDKEITRVCRAMVTLNVGPVDTYYRYYADSTHTRVLLEVRATNDGTVPAPFDAMPKPATGPASGEAAAGKNPVAITTILKR